MSEKSSIHPISSPIPPHPPDPPSILPSFELDSPSGGQIGSLPVSFEAVASQPPQLQHPNVPILPSLVTNPSATPSGVQAGTIVMPLEGAAVQPPIPLKNPKAPSQAINPSEDDFCGLSLARNEENQSYPCNVNSVSHSDLATPCAPTKPANNSPKKGTRSLRNRASKSNSGDPDLDAIRAANIAHDAKLQKDFDKEHGISRNTRSRTKQGGVQIAGFGAVRKQKKSVKFSPMLSDLRVKEFVSNTPHLLKRNQQEMANSGSSAGDKLDNLIGVQPKIQGVNNLGVASEIPEAMQTDHSPDVAAACIDPFR
ncbi:hypothetical protein Hanom_Chr15g01337361 [Helianthus anomalus]